MFLLSLLLLGSTLGAQPRTSTAQLLAKLESDDWRSRREAANELGELAPESKDVVRALAHTLGDSDARVRRSVARALGQFGRDASPAVSALIEALDDADPVVVSASARSLGRIGPRASRAVPALQSLLDDEDANIRQACAESLGLLGRRATRGIAELMQALRDPDAEVRASASRSLGQMGRRAGGAVPALIETLRDEDPSVRASASEALGNLGKSTVPLLVYALNDGNPLFLQSVVDTLGLIGAPAVPALVDTLSDERAPLIARRYTTLALASIGTDHKKVVPALTESLDDGAAEIRMSAAEALGKIGPGAAASTEKLIEISRDHREDALVREYALIALSRIAPDDASAFSALREAVGDANPGIHEAALDAMTRVVAPAGSEARVSELVRDLRASDAERRKSAATELGVMGPEASASVAALSVVVAGASNEAPVRIASARALGLIGPAAEEAVPVLIACLDSDDPELRRASLVALQRIGPQTQTIPALLEAMKAGNLAVRGPAAASIQNFASSRLETWRPMLYQSDAPVLRYWLERYQALYGVDASVSERDSRRREIEATDFFEVLGGRAAIRETLQLQLIDNPLTPADRERTRPVTSVDSVNVASHPFETMLEDSRLPPGKLPLADIVPVDRFFAVFTSLGAFRDTFDGGSDLFARLESAFAVKSIDYDLRSTYFARLGLSESVLDTLDATGLVSAIGIITPDLYFVDGTDITVIAELTPEAAAGDVLRVMGLDEPANVGVGSLEIGGTRSMFWARRGNRLVLSTDRNELESVLALVTDDDRESLGRSHELQYMLQQLPMEPDTEAYFYFSDPFIRHLVEPSTKIAQLRRMQARAEMETLLAGALLYKLDGHRSLPTTERLIELGYAPAHLEGRNYVIRDDLTVFSEKYGSIAALDPIGRNPVDRISEREAEAYRAFVDHYSRYWRQFFDPIAVRLNKTGEDELEMATFILPLLDSVVYDEVRSTLNTRETGARLDVPTISPKPSMLLSMNVNDTRRLEMSKMLAGTLVEYASVDPEIFDSIGSAIHVAVHDSTPIVALGAGDIWGVLSEDMLRMDGFGGLFPILLSLATQPTTVLIELEEPERVAAFLKDAVVRRAEAGGRGELHQLEGQESWIYTLDYDNVLQLHLRVAVTAGFLVIGNLPWRERPRIDDVTASTFNGAVLQLNLDTFDQQLPALHTKAFADYRRAAVDGMGYLFPLLASGTSATVDDALDEHFALFGYRPAHPLAGEWRWRHGEIASSIFGTALRPVQPEFVPGQRDFGLFPGLDYVSASLQLEESGLRARVRWRLTEK